MTDLVLYHADYSTCSQKVRIALAEKNIPFVSRPMSFRKEEQLSEDYLKINPNGVVPTLVHGGEAIVDSSCILEYLDEVFPGTPLVPDTPLARARMRSWLRFMEEVPTKAIRTPSFENVFLPAMRLIKSAKSFNKSRDRRTIRRGFYTKMNGGQGFDRFEIVDSVYQLRDTVMRIDQALKHAPWILGQQLTLVDISLVPLIDRAEDLGMGFLWDDLPAVADWLRRLQSRASFKAAFYKGSRLSERIEFKLAMRKARKQNGGAALRDFLEEVSA